MGKIAHFRNLHKETSSEIPVHWIYRSINPANQIALNNFMPVKLELSETLVTFHQAEHGGRSRFDRVDVKTNIGYQYFIMKILKISPPKTESFQIKIVIDCGYLLEPPRRGGYNKYPQSMFVSRNKRNNVYPCKALLYCIKVGFKGVKSI